MSGWRGLGGVTVWAAATAASAGLVWFGLTPVLDTAVPDRVQTVSEAELHDALDAGGAAGSTPTPAPPTPTATARPAPSREPGPTPASTTPGGRAPHRVDAAPPSTVDGWTIVEEADGSTSYLRRFEVEGGQTTIRMVPGRVELVAATPRPGFSVATTQNEPQRLLVRFLAPNRAFLIDAIWWDGRPFAEVSQIGG
ncbi:DNA mismatch repair protein MutL [Micromonospora pattaloongensis]|uniref:DNA mismatch repair protein MutL n=1 Tax=Micromonospora pattaloongensis TaxID=405436 RepID=UPI00111530EC|nr:DNA mismatch repair protein MutL [Micromonospora pattaloongensis]